MQGQWYILMEIPRSIGNYKIFGTLGQGGYGKVFVARDCKSLENFAIKFSRSVELLRKEYKMLQAINDLEGFVKVFEFNTINELGYMVMEMLGKSLQYSHGDLLLPLKTVAAVSIQVLTRLETLHSRGLLHQDLKPQQFLLSNQNKTISLIDFGLANYFMVQNKHKSFKTQCSFKGSASFASINCHMGFRQSRRDDLESLFYSLLYLAKGSLPWIHNSRLKGLRKWNFVLNLKVKTDKITLFKDLPQEFEIFLAYVRKLKYEESPNYSYLRSLMLKFVDPEPLYKNFEWILNPFFNFRTEIFVEMKKEKCFVLLRKGDWKIRFKRRNGYSELPGYAKIEKSDCFNSETQDLKTPSKVSRRRKRNALNVSASFSSRLDSPLKSSQLAEGILLNISEASFKSELLPQLRFFTSAKNCHSINELVAKTSDTEKNSDQCLTDRTELPEMKDKLRVLGKRQNVQKPLKETQATGCVLC